MDESTPYTGVAGGLRPHALGFSKGIWSPWPRVGSKAPPAEASMPRVRSTGWHASLLKFKISLYDEEQTLVHVGSGS